MTDTAPFRNEPLLELRRPQPRADLVAALAALDARLPLRAPVVIDGRAGTELPLRSVDPSRPDRVVALSGDASVDDADAAVAAARRAFADWSSRDAEDRAAVLIRAADQLRARRHELTALLLRETAKPWPEADADVCEAIDFLEYYARAAVALAGPRELVHVAGERNVMTYAARGVCAVIAPWNFALAIPAGMIAAALVTGNTVVLKPADQAPACAAALYDALQAAGLPAGALHVLPGGDEPAKALVAHPHVHTIAFTGSSAAGRDILRRAADVVPGQHHLKRVVCEMGGKNIVIVDSDADIDDVVPALLHSAFAFAGQKCSAAARVLVHADLYDELATRLAGAVATLQVSGAETFGVDVPPVIDAESVARVARYAEMARADGTVLAEATLPDGDDAVATPGFFAPPLLVADLPADCPILHEEIFGPLLSIEPVASIDAACDIVDASPFALTGGLFSRNPAVVAHVAARTPVGSLYVNREITGARVGRHPFGGNRLSGGGTKAGGPDYLLAFVEGRVVVENTVRHGMVV
ncbi:1-pyrroline-5-carboxylate dehydrogenase [Paraconexibacter sp. AEG42_29]|uniref:L-glutamate gamma-semialdehyde dehydrogenase n=1 Tax=Paraconexibacter sp. AEG42_29 TaxID=2997339 RepID=A0AAU7AQJ4_9ACTN